MIHSYAAHSVQPTDSVGVLVIFLPPYSPDLNPIEETFLHIKSYLKANEAVLQFHLPVECNCLTYDLVLQEAVVFLEPRPLVASSAATRWSHQRDTSLPDRLIMEISISDNS